MKRGLAFVAGLVVLLIASQGHAYIIGARSVFRRFAEKQALDRVKSGVLTGRAVLPEAGGREREVPVVFEVSVPGGCRVKLELPEGDSVAVLDHGKLSHEGVEVPGLAALVALGCPLATMKNAPAADAEISLMRMAGGLGVDVKLVALSRLGRRPAYVIGARARDLERAQIWFDKETTRPLRVIARHGGEVWDVRYDDPVSRATGRVHPRISEVWLHGERVLALRLMSAGAAAPDVAVVPGAEGEEDDAE